MDESASTVRRSSFVQRYRLIGRRGRAVRVRAATAVGLAVYALCATSGVMLGLSAAAGGHALVGRPLFDLQPADMQLLLVVAPGAGCFPVALVAYLARCRPLLARSLLAGVGLWLVLALATTYWLGIRPLVR